MSGHAPTAECHITAGKRRIELGHRVRTGAASSLSARSSNTTILSSLLYIIQTVLVWRVKTKLFLIVAFDTENIKET